MSMTEAMFDRVNDYAAVRIALASPNDIRSWSFGEVKKPETINYRTYRPERDGLFCERIFGPERDWECACGKYKGVKFKGIICDRCGVKVTHSRVRRKRMGHINLAAPIVHIWFFKSVPSRLGSLLDMKVSDLEKVIYFQDYVVTDPGQTPLKHQQLLTDDEWRSHREKYGDEFKAEMGAEAVKKLLEQLDLEAISQKIRADLAATNSKQKIKDLTKRLKIVENLRSSENEPEWMVMDVVPVIPPDLRPLVLLESGNFATSDLNDLYRRIINRNNRLKRLIDLNAPEVIIRNEKRMLQQAVDSLFDNGRVRRPVLGSSNRPLKSLTDMIKGKQGRFRENLLGKRVDYSARSVIVVGPELKLHQCGLPKRIALELFQPFIIRKLKERGLADTIKSAKRMIDRRDEEIWDVLEEVIHQHPVLLNRAPTLHRMGIQAFEPVLVEGNAINIHPLVCRGFNADFDGDQMAVHLPLSVEAQAEAHCLMLSTHNIFSPANGSPIISPSQDIVMGNYYLTIERGEDDFNPKLLLVPSTKGKRIPLFCDEREAIMAFERGLVRTHAPIKIRTRRKQIVLGQADQPQPAPANGLIETTPGRCIFNDMLHPDMPFYNCALGSKGQSRVIDDCYAYLGRAETIDFLDRLKSLGFRWGTLAGLSFGITDPRIPARKEEILGEVQKKVNAIEKSYNFGAITERERKAQVLEQWAHAREEVTKEMMLEIQSDTREPDSLRPIPRGQPGGKPYVNPVFLMSESGARGSKDQIRQLAGMRGLMAKPSGEIIETPIKANFREGLSVLEYFSSTHGARKGLADTALKTADSGYLTRKLADVAQNVIVSMPDCGTIRGITKTAVRKGENVEVPLRDLIRGRVSRRTIRNPVTDEIIVRENEIISEAAARRIEAPAPDGMGLETVEVRSPLTCEAPMGICQNCYGWDMSTQQMVEPGMAVGIIAAQSIGEPGTQLTMRTFHMGGVATSKLDERDRRANQAGTVEFVDLATVNVRQADGTDAAVSLKRSGEIRILNDKGYELESHKVPYAAIIRVQNGQKVKAKDLLCEWDPHLTPILAEKAGVIRFRDIEEGETIRYEAEMKGQKGKPVVIEHKGNKSPQVLVESSDGQVLDFHHLPAKARIEVADGQAVQPGDLIARLPRELAKTQDITGGLPRVSEIFEARKPRDPATLAEISGRVEIRTDKRRDKMTIIITSDAGIEKDHHIPNDKRLLVHTGDVVDAGEPLCEGPAIPHDILRIKGDEALYTYMLQEVQRVYLAQNVRINDKHVELIINQMLRKVKVETPNDSRFLPGEVTDKTRYREEDDRLRRSVRISDPGDSELHEDQIVEKTALQAINEQLEAEGRKPAKGKRPKGPVVKSLLLGITKASLQSESFLSAASFQETTKVLTQAALCGATDKLVGLKENVSLGHLIHAGTGFDSYQAEAARVELLGKPVVVAEEPVAPEIEIPPEELADHQNGEMAAPQQATSIIKPAPTGA